MKSLFKLLELRARARAQGYTSLGLVRMAIRLVNDEMRYMEYIDREEERQENKHVLEGHNDWEEFI